MSENHSPVDPGTDLVQVIEPPPVAPPPPAVPVLTDENTLTWADLTTVQVKTVFVPKYGKYIQYRASIPLEMMTNITVQYPQDGSTRTALDRLVALLTYVMISPQVTPASALILAKADQAVINNILGDVLNAPEAAKAAKTLGEA